MKTHIVHAIVKHFSRKCALTAVLFCSLAGYPPFSDDRSDKPMNEQILKGDYLHYLKEPFWKAISDNGK